MRRPAVLACLAALSLGGCLGPDYEKVADKLFAKNLELEQENDKLKQQLQDSQATVQDLQDKAAQNSPRVETLPPSRLKDLFTVDRVRLQGSTDAWDFDGDGRIDGFRVFVRTQTEDGITLPATGSLSVEAFDLAIDKGAQKIGSWAFTPEQLKKSWYGGFGLDHFAVNCPWDKPPGHRDITFKIKFTDALTGKTLTDQKVIKVRLAAASGAAS